MSASDRITYYQRDSVLTYRRTLGVSTRALACCAIRSLPTVPAGEEAATGYPLVAAWLRNGETLTALAGGFAVGLTTVWRYVHQGLGLCIEVDYSHSLIAVTCRAAS